VNTVFVDIDTQIDFLFPAGALYVPGAETALPVISALNQHAGRIGTVVISSADAHAEDDPEFAAWPHHCVAGTVGQLKPASTLLDRRVIRLLLKNSISIFSPMPIFRSCSIT
jgi:nicotinamidase/pyrazinamidase